MQPNKIAFDQKAHSILSELLDNTEDWLVRHKECEPQSANDRLAYDYIMRCSGVIRGATTFVANDERIGTQQFISDLRGASTKTRSIRSRTTTTAQLMKFPHIYFPNYLTVLQLTFLRELPNLKTRSIILLSGVVKLAAANLPGVRSDVRRELRRRGDERNALIVPDDTLERQLGRFEQGLLTIRA